MSTRCVINSFIAWLVVLLCAVGNIDAGEPQKGWREASPTTSKEVAAPTENDQSSGEKIYTVAAGTRIPVSLINSISTKHSAVGDRVYLETVFPIVVDGKVVIPAGSYVAGTITEVKRPGRIKGRGELYIRFDSLTLPNGVNRSFGGRVGSLDGTEEEELDREEGAVRSSTDKGGDARTIAETTVTGTSIGAIAGAAASGRPGLGAGIGAAAGAAAGIVTVLATRGPEVVLPSGTTLEMVLDRPLHFRESELDFANVTGRPGRRPAARSHDIERERTIPLPRRVPGLPWPF